MNMESSTIPSDTDDDPSIVGIVLAGVEGAQAEVEHTDNIVVALHPEVNELVKEETALLGDGPIVSVFGVPVVVTEEVPDFRVVDFTP